MRDRPASSPPWPYGESELARLVRARDWGSTPLGPVERWSTRLKAAVEQVLASPTVASLACGPERLLIYNDAAARFYGDRHPGALGRPMGAAFPEAHRIVAPFYDRVFAGESLHVPAQPLDTAGGGDPFVFDAYLSPVRDGDGAVIAAHMVGVEIGERLRADKALRDSEERRAFLLKLSDTLRGEADERRIEQVALGTLAEQLSADRTYITTSDYGKGETVVPAEVQRVELPRLTGVFFHSDWPESARRVNEGTIVVTNAGEDADLSEHNRKSLRRPG